VGCAYGMRWDGLNVTFAWDGLDASSARDGVGMVGFG